MLNVTKTYLPPLEKYESYLKEIWKSGHITNNGPLTKLLESKLTEHLDVDGIQLVSNGTIALQLAIKSLGLTGEVITTPFSYVATVTSLIWEQCEPVFVDIEKETFGINSNLIEESITENTSAILATHVYGYPCEVEKIQKIADKYNLKVIYDAAHAFGVTYNGQSVLQFGDVSTLSFHATKLFHTVEGGGVISKDLELLNNISLLKSFGHIGEDNYFCVGINGKMSEIHAAMGLCVIDDINHIIQHRKKCSLLYDEYLLEHSDLTRPIERKGVKYNYAYYPIIFSTSEQMHRARECLISNDIYPRRYFYPSLNKMPYIESNYHCPVSEDISKKVLALPLSSELSTAEVVKVSQIIIESLK